jgi:hypothetical protein
VKYFFPSNSNVSSCCRRLATEKMNVNALLTKYTRMSSVGGVRYYSAKHAR